MWSKLVSIISSLQSGSLKRILGGAGIYLASSAMFITAFGAAVNTLRSSVSGISGDVLALAHLAGFDVAMTIVLSAVVTRLSLNSSKLVLRKSS
ncbi:DUF2523 family protein [Acinetobacter seifertii]|uniref:DUF2523 family protein n=1 Tax=Acinetobacter seifertii TaxID=1530123 RepID=UPI000C1F2379|nr:DUF2523 family protein [Acinetobacter seifertii]PJF05138.1 hypothetical protein CVD06_03310 [Acinetobacter seifertii]PJG69292.1 hypothetical protein CVD08_15565 [Acinetobacter seifertii]